MSDAEAPKPPPDIEWPFQSGWSRIALVGTVLGATLWVGSTARLAYGMTQYQLRKETLAVFEFPAAPGAEAVPLGDFDLKEGATVALWELHGEEGKEVEILASARPAYSATVRGPDSSSESFEPQPRPFSSTVSGFEGKRLGKFTARAAGPHELTLRLQEVRCDHRLRLAVQTDPGGKPSVWLLVLTLGGICLGGLSGIATGFELTRWFLGRLQASRQR